MKIVEILQPNMLIADLKALDKEGVLREMASHICAQTAGAALSENQAYDALLEREHLGSTGVGEGIAIPHAKIPGLENLVAGFGRSLVGIPFDSVDKQPAKLIFVLLVPENSAGAHLKALARISRLMKNQSFREQLLAAPTGDAIFQAFVEEDQKI